MSTTVDFVTGDDETSWGSDRSGGAANLDRVIPAGSSDASRDPGTSASPAHAAGAGHDPSAGLVAAVDALEAVSTEPVRTHAERYHAVHTMLQDALSATDRPGS